MLGCVCPGAVRCPGESGWQQPGRREAAASAQRHLGDFGTALPQWKVTGVRPWQGEEGTRGQSDGGEGQKV